MATDISNRTAGVMVVFIILLLANQHIYDWYYDVQYVDAEHPDPLWKEPPPHVLQNTATYADALARWCALLPDDLAINTVQSEYLHNLAFVESRKNPPLAFYAWNAGLTAGQHTLCRDVPPKIAWALN
jgi:hypothetical protein